MLLGLHFMRLSCGGSGYDRYPKVHTSFCKSISDKSGHDATGTMYGTRRAVWCGLSLPL